MSMIFTNEIITGSFCITNNISLYYLVSGHHLLHLTFSKDAHQQAKDWLKADQRIKIIQEKSSAHPVCRHLADYLAGGKNIFTIPTLNTFIDQGTDFQKRVWQKIAQIPYSETRTYGELAVTLGSRGLSRAVGQACNKNPLAIIVPCHRVVGTGGLGGFAGGIMVKKLLLDSEQKH